MKSRLIGLAGRGVALSCLIWLTAAAAWAGQEKIGVAYRVAIERAGQRFVSVEMKISGLDRPTLDVAIPAWTPGSYEILNYAQYLSGMEARGASGKNLFRRNLDKQSWRIDTAGEESVTIRYKVRCDHLTVDSNWLGPTYGQLQGAATFLYLIGRRDIPVTIEYALPTNWTVVTALSENGGPTRFKAGNYDAVVDAPVVVGEINRSDIMVREAKISIVTVRRPADPDGLRANIAKIVNTYADMMGGLPFDRYCFLYLPHEPDENDEGLSTEGLEHADSTLINYSPETLIDNPSSPEFLSVTAHEFFHAWNVKRLRPKELTTIDYSRETYTPSLWFAEGVTEYYTLLGLVRARLMTIEGFAEYFENTITALENTEDRKTLSLEDASVTTWLTGTSHFDEIPVDYYGKGALVGLMLDLEIRSRSNGKATLDDLMRSLYRRYAAEGYTYDDIVAEAGRLAGSDLGDFFKRYVRGTADIPYAEIFEKLGMAIEVEKVETAYQGFELTPGGGSPIIVEEVIADTPAEAAGMEPGDEIVRLNSKLIKGLPDLADAGKDLRPGISAKYVVKRDGKLVTLTLTPELHTEMEATVTLLDDPSAAQKNLRAALFNGLTGLEYKEKAKRAAA